MFNLTTLQAFVPLWTKKITFDTALALVQGFVIEPMLDEPNLCFVLTMPRTILGLLMQVTTQLMQ